MEIVHPEQVSVAKRDLRLAGIAAVIAVLAFVGTCSAAYQARPVMATIAALIFAFAGAFALFVGLSAWTRLTRKTVIR